MSEDEARKLNEAVIRHDERLEALENNWTDLKGFMECVQKELGRLSSYNIDVAKSIKNAVFGNGKPGLMQDMVVASQSITSLRELIEERRKIHDKELADCRDDFERRHEKDIGRLERAIGWFFGIMVAAMGAVLFYLITAHIEGRLKL